MIVAWYAKRKKKEVLATYPPAPILVRIDDGIDIFVILNATPGEPYPVAPVLLSIDDERDIMTIQNTPAT